MLHQVIETISLFALNTIETLGYFGVFILMALESANIPIPSEVIMPFAGFLVVQGSFNFWLVVFIGAFGNLAGSLVSYYLARYYGLKPLLFLSKIYLVHESHIATAENFFKKYGNLSAFIARFVPVIRTFISYPAGMFKVPVLNFAIFTFVGSFIWSWLLALIGYKLGENWETIGLYLRQADYAIAAIAIIFAVWWVWGIYREHKKVNSL
ncbi:MAG: DedA family protein [bacterium]|nr:DedA family protein [bacterium]